MATALRTLQRLAVAHLVATVAMVAVMGVGAAYAYFSSAGTGSGSASTGTLQQVTLVAVTGTPQTHLQPGGTGDVLLSVTNPNASPVQLVSVTGGGALSVRGGTSCTAANAGVAFHDQSGLAVTIPAHASSVPVTLANAASMAYASASGCQGATFLIPVTITVHS